MPTASTTITTTALFSPLFRPHPAAPPLSARLVRPSAIARRGVSCQVAVTTDVSSSSPSAAEEEAEAAEKVGKRIRVKVPLKVYHVMKAPELDLNGMEGTIKQYVGVWKGKRISANLPFKVEFVIDVDGQPRPVKFFAHLKEDEFEYLPASE